MRDHFGGSNQHPYLAQASAVSGAHVKEAFDQLLQEALVEGPNAFMWAQQQVDFRPLLQVQAAKGSKGVLKTCGSLYYGST